MKNLITTLILVLASTIFSQTEITPVPLQNKTTPVIIKKQGSEQILVSLNCIIENPISYFLDNSIVTVLSWPNVDEPPVVAYIHKNKEKFIVSSKIKNEGYYISIKNKEASTLNEAIEIIQKHYGLRNLLQITILKP